MNKDLKEKIIEKIIEIKRRLEEAKIDTSHLLYCPQIPMLGIEKEFVIEEIFGIKVARLISSPQD